MRRMLIAACMLLISGLGRECDPACLTGLEVDRDGARLLVGAGWVGSALDDVSPWSNVAEHDLVACVDVS